MPAMGVSPPLGGRGTGPSTRVCALLGGEAMQPDWQGGYGVQYGVTALPSKIEDAPSSCLAPPPHDLLTSRIKRS